MAQKRIIYQKKEFFISYEILHQENEQAIIFLHGWGANKELMKQAFSKSFANFKHVYVDLCGFGASTNDLVMDTHAHAQLMELFLDALNVNVFCIFGHSFGGKVATLLSPPRLVLLSSAGILEPKKAIVSFKIFCFGVLKKLGLGAFRKFFVSKDATNLSAKMYEGFKLIIKEDFTPHFNALSSKTWIFWGRQDSATSLESGKKIHSLIPNSEFFALEGGHYFFLDKAKTIEEKTKNFNYIICSKTPSNNP